VAISGAKLGHSLVGWLLSYMIMMFSQKRGLTQTNCSLFLLYHLVTMRD